MAPAVLPARRHPSIEDAQGSLGVVSTVTQWYVAVVESKLAIG